MKTKIPIKAHCSREYEHKILNMDIYNTSSPDKFQL